MRGERDPSEARAFSSPRTDLAVVLPLAFLTYRGVSPPSSTARPWPISARTGPLAVAEHPERLLIRWRRAGLWCADDRGLRVTGGRSDHRPDARFRVRSLAPMENLTPAERPKAAAVAPAASSARLGAAGNGKLDQHGGNAANWRLADAPSRRAAICLCRAPVRQPSVVVSGGLAECDLSPTRNCEWNG